MNDKPETIESLRERFAPYCKPIQNTHLKPLKTICMVGAFNSANGMPSYELDKLYLHVALIQLQKYKIPVDPAFDIEIENKDPQEGGKDFLERTKPADLVILCCIFNPDPEDAHQFLRKSPAGFFTISPHHFEKSSWMNAAIRVGAKVIGVIGDDHSSEVGPGRFMPANDNSPFVRMDPTQAYRQDMKIHLLRHHDFK